MISNSSTLTNSIDTQHEDVIHDVQMNYYGRRIATCSSDKLIKIFQIGPGDVANPTPSAVLRRHEGPVWQVSWAHPKFGTFLASCSYDRKVYIWKEVNRNDWKIVYEHAIHTLSVNSIAWAPHEFGLCLACGSSDGYISILSHDERSDSFISKKFEGHNLGVNSVSWAPISPKRVVSGGCDNAIKIWNLDREQIGEPLILKEHEDWVRDVAWAPIGLPSATIASCSQDGTVIIWRQDDPSKPFSFRRIHKSSEVVWRVSWSITGNILSIAGGDNKVILMKEIPEVGWKPLYTIDETGQFKE